MDTEDEQLLLQQTEYYCIIFSEPTKKCIGWNHTHGNGCLIFILYGDSMSNTQVFIIHLVQEW